MTSSLKYLSGFGSHFESEALPNTLPVGQNSPQVCPHGLYAEQLSGTAFTAPRVANFRTWLYRIRPSVCHSPYQKAESNGFLFSDFSSSAAETPPDQFRWKPLQMPEDSHTDFVSGLVTYCGSGDASTKSGLAVHMYRATADMGDKCMYNSDGDFLIVPQQGGLDINTEMGKMTVVPGEIAVVQRGIRFRVNLMDGQPIRGYMLEVYDGHFKLPDLGPIGANGLANPRDFLHPCAWFEDRSTSFTIVNKFLGNLYECKMQASPFDVVAWHGNYVPYKYDLSRFCTMNAVSFDHADPSIFTVLTCPSNEPGVAVADFVIFPWRWVTAEHTFRPPYYHRNCMSEFMGLIRGQYEAKEEGFCPGGATLHSCMTPHGPDRLAFEKATNAPMTPFRIDESTLAFMFESTYLFRCSPVALGRVPGPAQLDVNYASCWQGLESHFSPPS